jgi:predicted flap endonuclease-1-like 5' DNA nuclease
MQEPNSKLQLLSQLVVKGPGPPAQSEAAQAAFQAVDREASVRTAGPESLEDAVAGPRGAEAPPAGVQVPAEDQGAVPDLAQTGQYWL